MTVTTIWVHSNEFDKILAQLKDLLYSVISHNIKDGDIRVYYEIAGINNQNKVIYGRVKPLRYEEIEKNHFVQTEVPFHMPSLEEVYERKVYMASRTRILAVDFDGTVVTHMYPQIGKEADDCVRVLKRVQEAGHKIILWTCRESDPEAKRDTLKEAVEWMYESGIQLHNVNDTKETDDFRNPAGLRRKVLADCYVDDRNIGIPKKHGCVDWSWVEKKLEEEGWFE